MHVIERVGLERERRSELAKLEREPLLRELHVRAEIDHRAHVDLAQRRHRDRDLILDDKLTVLDRERARGALLDHAAAELVGVLR